ncbi:MAG TPA: TIGR03118 family protein [Puia sp.]|nr:TIGR03118 family protein [Puia sp.]
MKTNVFLLALLMAGAGCHKDYNTTAAPLIPGTYQETDLVTDVAIGYGAARIDPPLLNAWGIAVNPAGIVWISANHAGATTVYDSTGKTVLGPVAIPSQGTHFGGSPTGVVFNGTTDFVIPSNQKIAKFIFVNEDGTVSAWGAGDSTITVADRSSSDAVYKGVALANDGSGNFLYAANFKGGKIDVFDKNFVYISTRPFADPGIPAGFGPFNIQNIGGKLYVTYAKLKGPDNTDDQAGAGNGYVDVFNPDGTLVKRFASQGLLNSPWGLAQVPAGFGLPRHSILIGNFGDGRINVYDSTGVFNGQLQNNGYPITIAGLWALDFPNNEATLADPNKLYFTAGPMDESHGLFGFLKM